MENNASQPTNEPLAPYPQPDNQAVPGRQRSGKRWIIIGLAVILVGGLLFWLAGTDKNKDDAATSSGNAEGLVFDMFKAAAAKQKVHFTYAERKYDSRAKLKDKAQGYEAYSVAEINAANQDFRSVYIARGGSTVRPSYEAGRCLEGRSYQPESLARPQRLQNAVSLLDQPTRPLPDSGEERVSGCQANDAPRNGRLTDGIIPIGLSDGQINKWVQHLKDANFLQIKDDGTTTYKGTAVRKVRVVTNSVAGVGSFYEAAENGAGLGLTAPTVDKPAADTFRLDDIPTMDNINGFYLIDNKTNLPVYSEFTTASLINDKTGYVFKQAYSYPDDLTITANTKLVILE